ncbi:hypothetical protein ELUMI_v1c08270 [Williamsoniiplasma luminosum]|uniref:Uncharacterized protein n=1 Tax=Williamsoniiplasma luminosum TaxID=214888 RepID=A0A2K8NWH4_9MOLU|nr:hypothetical protein ELUMI_v1c08270 [Williamsoniiplasma luminosum]
MENQKQEKKCCQRKYCLVRVIREWKAKRKEAKNK